MIGIIGGMNMNEKITYATKIWIVFPDQNFNSAPLCKVKTLNNNEEYFMGIQLLKLNYAAIEEHNLVSPIPTLPLLSLNDFYKAYAP